MFLFIYVRTYAYICAYVKIQISLKHQNTRAHTLSKVIHQHIDDLLTVIYKPYKPLLQQPAGNQYFQTT